MLSYSEAKKAFIHGLSHDAAAHEAGHYQQIGAGFDELDVGLPRERKAEFDKLFIALNFWDGWIDARNHDWQYYKGIRESDWPILANQIVKALAEDREITEPAVLTHFDFRQRRPKSFLKSLLEQIRRITGFM